MTSGHAPVDAGFSLLEVMVALAIALPALVLLFREGPAAVATTRAASAYEEAVSRAQSRLDALAANALTGSTPEAGEREGDDGGFYHWRTTVAVLGTTGPLQPGARGTHLYAVQVEVSWPGSAGNRRRVVLNSMELGPVGGGSMPGPLVAGP